MRFGPTIQDQNCPQMVILLGSMLSDGPKDQASLMVIRKEANDHALQPMTGKVLHTGRSQQSPNSQTLKDDGKGQT